MQSVAHAAPRTNSNNSILQLSFTAHLSSCGVCVFDSDVSARHFIAALSSVFVGGCLGGFSSFFFHLGFQRCKGMFHRIYANGESGRSRRKLSNEYLVAELCFNTDENEPSAVCQDLEFSTGSGLPVEPRGSAAAWCASAAVCWSRPIEACSRSGWSAGSGPPRRRSARGTRRRRSSRSLSSCWALAVSAALMKLPSWLCRAAQLN